MCGIAVFLQPCATVARPRAQAVPPRGLAIVSTTNLGVHRGYILQPPPSLLLCCLPKRHHSMGPPILSSAHPPAQPTTIIACMMHLQASRPPVEACRRCIIHTRGALLAHHRRCLVLRRRGGGSQHNFNNLKHSARRGDSEKTPRVRAKKQKLLFNQTEKIRQKNIQPRSCPNGPKNIEKACVTCGGQDFDMGHTFLPSPQA